MEIIADLIEQNTDELVAAPDEPGTIGAVYRLTMLMLIVSAKIQIRQYPGVTADDIGQLARLIGAVFRYVVQTDAILPIIANADGVRSYVVSLEKAVMRFVFAFRRDYLSPAKPAIEQVYATLEGDQHAAFDLFVNRFLRDLELFLAFPELLEEISKFLLELITESEKDPSTKEFVVSNTMLQGLTQRELFLNFSVVENFEKCKLLLSLLNRIYARSIKTVDGWAPFLAHFDDRFASIAARRYGNAHAIFCLYREVCGVLSGNCGYRDYLIIFRWFLARHVDDTLACIRSQGGSMNTILAIGRAWCLLCSNKGKKLVLPPASAEGIVLFQSSLKVIQALVEAVMDTDDRTMLICKIIRPSLSENYANFGVMDFYGDPSLDQMLQIFFAILDGWEFDQVKALKNGARTILEAIHAIIQHRPAKFEEGDRSALVLNFLWRTLGWKQSTEQVWSLSENCFKHACNCLQDLMLFLLPKDGIDWSIFRQHFITLMDVLFAPPSPNGPKIGPVIDMVAGPLCYLAKMDSAFVEVTFRAICNGFDEQYREAVGGLLHTAFETVEQVTSPDQLQKFRHALNQFKKEVLRYSIQLFDIPGFLDFCQMP
jgi:hypothetical protein